MKRPASVRFRIRRKANPLKEQIQALYDRIEKLHDPVLQAYLEQAVQIKPAPPSLEDLVKKATKKPAKWKSLKE